MKYSITYLLTIVMLGGYFITFHLLPIPAQEEIRLSFGIVPQQSSTKLAQLWGPILQYLSEETGYTLIFKTAKNIPTFEQRVADGEYDIAYMNPYHYTVFHISPGYEAFAKQKDIKIQGLIVTRKDRPYKDIKELEGQTLAFPSPAAFAASILTRAYFLRHNIPITPKYVTSHDSVYLAVAKGLYPAGGGIQRTFNNISPDVRDQLRILWKTEQYTPHAIAAHPRVPREIVFDLQQAMIAMGDEPRGKRLFEEINFTGIEAAADKDWDDVRALEINLLDDFIKK